MRVATITAARVHHDRPDDRWTKNHRNVSQITVTAEQVRPLWRESRRRRPRRELDRGRGLWQG